jgi:hypothetical protein
MFINNRIATVIELLVVVFNTIKLKKCLSYARNFLSTQKHDSLYGASKLFSYVFEMCIIQIIYCSGNSAVVKTKDAYTLVHK